MPEPDPELPRQAERRRRMLLIAFFVADVGAQVLGNVLYFDTNRVATLWPASGLLLGVLRVAPRRDWPVLLALAWLAQAVSDVGVYGRSLDLHVLFALVNLGEATLGASILRALFGAVTAYAGMAQVGWFILIGALGSTAVAAAAGALIVTGYFPGATFVDVALIWWFSDATGVLLIAPCVAAFSRPEGRILRSNLEAAVLLGLLVLVLVMVFGRPVGEVVLVFDQAFVLLPLLFWAALRFGARAALVLLAASGLTIALMTRHGLGPFCSDVLPVRDTVLRLQGFLAVVSFSLLALLAVRRQERQTLAALQESELHFHSLASLSPTGMVQLDTTRLCTYVNERFAELTGRAASACLGTGWLDALRVADGPAREALLRRLESLDPVELEQEGDAQRFLLGQARRDAARDHLIVGFTDISAQRSLELQLRHAQKMEAIGRLAGGIAHDFNNLLTGIIGYAELAGDQLDADSAAGKGLREIHRTAQRAAGLTRQLLAFSRKQLVQTADIDLVRVIADAGAVLARSIGERHRLRMNLDRGQLPVRAVGDQIEQILFNLVLNARDASTQHTEITVWARAVEFTAPVACVAATLAPGHYAEMAVEDRGEGIEAADLERIFDPFFTTKPVGQGTGLGLAMVYGIVMQHGGGIVVETARGHGSTFKVFLPLLDTRLTEKAAPARQSAAAGERILVVEDDAQIRQVLVKMLATLGYEVRVADSGAAALELIDSFRPHLLMTDVVMPDMDGLELSARVQQIAPRLPVLFMSGYAQDVDPSGRLAAHDLPFIQKPFTRDQLAQRVREVLIAAAQHDGARTPDPL